MTILPKKKGVKEGNSSSRANSHGPASPLDPPHPAHPPHPPQLQNITPYGILTEAAASASTDSYPVAGPSHRPNGSSVLGFPSSFNRNKKQKVYSDDEEEEEEEEDEESDGSQEGRRVRTQRPLVSRGARDGNNSDDERGADRDLTAEELASKEANFGRLLKEKRGFVIKKMKEDGACLFRAVADQVLGDEEMHDMVRQQCLDYMERNEDYFSQYITEDFSQYVGRKRSLTAHGNHVEIQAMSEVYNRRIEVYEYDIDAMNVFQGVHHDNENAPIRVSYHQKTHYNSVVDPFAATIGVGLGMPNFQPGLAEERLMNEAMGQSEEEAGLIEKQMLEDKILETDWEAANEAIERQIAQESYLEWLKMTEKRSRCDEDGAPSTSASSRDHPKSDNERETTSSPGRSETPGCSETPGRSETPCERRIIDQLNHLPPALFGLNDWDEEEGDMLARVLATSQAEYLDSLKPKDRSST